MPTAMKIDRSCEFLFSTPPVLLRLGNPTRDTNRSK
jgi:hypothetical protein